MEAAGPDKVSVVWTPATTDKAAGELRIMGSTSREADIVRALWNHFPGRYRLLDIRTHAGRPSASNGVRIDVLYGDKTGQLMNTDGFNMEAFVARLVGQLDFTATPPLQKGTQSTMRNVRRPPGVEVHTAWNTKGEHTGVIVFIPDDLDFCEGDPAVAIRIADARIGTSSSVNTPLGQIVTLTFDESADHVPTTPSGQLQVAWRAVKMAFGPHTQDRQ